MQEQTARDRLPWRGAASLRSALLLLVAIAFLAGILPAGVVLERWLTAELERRAARDVAMAPQLVATRDAALHDAMMMHAKEMSQANAVAAALRAGDRSAGVAIAEQTARAYNYAGVLLASDGAVWIGPSGATVLEAQTRAGEMPVRVVSGDAGLHLVSVAPVMVAGQWLGAVGVALALDASAAGALAAVTHSHHVLIIGADGQRVDAPGDSVLGAQIARAFQNVASTDGVRELHIGNRRYLVSAASLGGATALFVRDMERELAMLPLLHRAVMLTGAGALGVALLFGYILAGWLARPVRQLAAAAERLSAGDFAAPLPVTAVREVARVTDAFADMRRALSARLDELRSANRLLEERQARLSALQSELIKRERVATSARMATELAHEIRNPVANIRNCLELLERRLARDPEGREFASLAIEELLRMHELAERMLQLNRPHGVETGSCDAVAVARDVIALVEIGNTAPALRVTLTGDTRADVVMAADALKQILLNLVQNARDAVPAGLVVDIAVRKAGEVVYIRVGDNGPGIPPQLRGRIFDPFFTTRAQAGGIGLGLFVVEGMVRGHGGTVSLVDRDGAAGACFELRLPAAPLSRVASQQDSVTAAAAT